MTVGDSVRVMHEGHPWPATIIVVRYGRDRHLYDVQLTSGEKLERVEIYE